MDGNNFCFVLTLQAMMIIVVLSTMTDEKMKIADVMKRSVERMTREGYQRRSVDTKITKRRIKME